MNTLNEFLNTLLALALQALSLFLQFLLAIFSFFTALIYGVARSLGLF